MGVSRSPRSAHRTSACATASALQRAWSWSGAGKTLAIGLVLPLAAAPIKGASRGAYGYHHRAPQLRFPSYIALQHTVRPDRTHAHLHQPIHRTSAMIKGKNAVVTGSTS